MSDFVDNAIRVIVLFPFVLMVAFMLLAAIVWTVFEVKHIQAMRHYEKSLKEYEMGSVINPTVKSFTAGETIAAGAPIYIGADGKVYNAE